MGEREPLAVKCFCVARGQSTSDINAVQPTVYKDSRAEGDVGIIKARAVLHTGEALLFCLD